MSATAVRGGQVFIEIGADPKKFFAALNGLQKRIGQMGSSMSSLGTKMAGLGAATLAPFALAVRQGSAFQSTLLNIKASTGATATELDSLKAAALQMSAAMGVGPTQITQSFLELLKAGMSVEQVLGGAGKAAVEFAAVGQMDVAAAGVVMADAMKVFGVTADVAANALSSAADASSTSIEGISQAFSQASAVAALANQSLGDTSAALAILANAGIKGSDAGTSLKTMLLRLMAPADEAVGALDAIGLSVSSFRNADGSMKPLVDIIGTLNGALGGMDQAAKDDIFRQIFGSDAIRAAAVLTSTGVEGFNAMTGAMGGAASVGDKFKTMMSGLAGAAGTIFAALERLSIAATDALGPALMDLSVPITGLVDGIANFIRENEALVISFAKGVAIFTGVGLALLALGGTLTLIGGGMGALIGIFTGVAAAVAFVMSPIGLLIGSLAAIAYFGPQIAASFGVSFGGISAMVDQASAAIGGGFGEAVASAAVVFSDLGNIASTTFSGIYEAIADGDLSGAMDILWLGLVAGWNRGTEAIMGLVDPWIETFQNIFADVGTEIVIAWENMWSALAQNSWGQYLLGFIDNIVNTAMATFDWLVGSIQKAWAKVQDFITGGNEADARIKEIDNKNAARAEQRAQERPGIEGRTNKSDEELDKMKKESEDRVAAMRQNAKDEKAERAAATNKNKADRREASEKSEQELGGRAKKARAGRVMNQQFSDLLKEVEGASSLDQLRDLYGQFDALSQGGRLSSAQAATLETALEDAQERVSKATSSMGGASPSQKIKDGAGAAGADAAASPSEVAGTFSAVAAGQMGVGQSLAQKQLDTLKTIEQNTRPGDDGLVAA